MDSHFILYYFMIDGSMFPLCYIETNIYRIFLRIIIRSLKCLFMIDDSLSYL